MAEKAGSAGSKRSRSARASSTRPASNCCARALVDAPAVLGGLHDELQAEDGRRVAEWRRERPVAAERRDLERADDATRVAEVGAGGDRRREGLEPRRQRLDPVVARAPPPARRGRPGRAAARPCRCPPSRPAARTPSRRRGSRRRPARPAPAAPRARAPGSRRPCTARRGPRGRCRGGRPEPAPRASPWPSRCRGRGRPAASRPRRSPPGCRGRAAAPRARSRGRSCRSRSARRGRPAAPARRPARHARGLVRAQASVPRSAYGPPWSTRTRTSSPTSAGDARHVDELVLARAAGEVGDALGQVRERVARLGRAGGLLVVVVVAARRDDGVDEDLGRRARSTPGCARARSPPARRAARSSRRRFSAAGTSSARRVAGVPGRSL